MHTVTTVRAAAVQLSPVLYSRDGTVERVVAKIDELATRDVQFATFPETVVPYYPYFSFVQRPYEMMAEQTRLMEQSVTVPSSATQAIADDGTVTACPINRVCSASISNGRCTNEKYG